MLRCSFVLGGKLSRSGFKGIILINERSLKNNLIEYQRKPGEYKFAIIQETEEIEKPKSLLSNIPIELTKKKQQIHTIPAPYQSLTKLNTEIKTIKFKDIENNQVIESVPKIIEFLFYDPLKPDQNEEEIIKIIPELEKFYDFFEESISPMASNLFNTFLDTEKQPIIFNYLNLEKKCEDIEKLEKNFEKKFTSNTLKNLFEIYNKNICKQYLLHRWISRGYGKNYFLIHNDKDKSTPTLEYYPSPNIDPSIITDFDFTTFKNSVENYLKNKKNIPFEYYNNILIDHLLDYATSYKPPLLDQTVNLYRFFSPFSDFSCNYFCLCSAFWDVSQIFYFISHFFVPHFFSSRIILLMKKIDY